MRTAWLLAAGMAALAATEVRRADLFLAAEALPTRFAYTLASRQTGGERQGEDRLDRALGLRLGGRWTWSAPGRAWAPQFGADVLGEDAACGSLRLRAYGAALAAGLAWCPRPGWLAEVEGYVQQGRIAAEAGEQPEHAAFAVAGTCAGQGVRAGLAWAITRRWHAALSAGWLQTAAELDGDDVDLDLRRSGPTASLGLVWRLDLRAAALE